MTDTNEPNSPEFVVTFADLRAIFRKNRGRIKFCVITVALLSFVFALCRPVLYETKAVFHQKGKSSSGLNSDMFQTLFSMSQPESEGIIAMKSMRLSRELAQKHAMQAEIVKDEYEFPFLPISTVVDNVLLEYALWTDSQFPILQDKRHPVLARHVVYDKITPTTLSLEVISPKNYLLKRGKDTIGEGLFGKLLITEDFTILLDFGGDEKRDLGKYNLTLQPLNKVAKNVQGKFYIISDPNDKNLISITYKNPQRNLAVDHVNSLMGLYQKYVNDEHKRIASAQLEYLIQRQQNMGEQLRTMMQEHAQSLSMDLSTTGFATSQMAMEFLATNQQNMRQKLLTLELEIQRLDNIRKDSISDFDKFLSIGSSDWINRIIAEMRSLKQQADSLSLALRSSSLAMASYEDSFNSQLIELDEIKQSAQESREMLASLKSDKVPDASPKILDNPRFIVRSWYDRLIASRDEPNEGRGVTNWQKAKEGFSSYLTHLIDYLQVHQRNIEERLNHQQTIHTEFQGISPNTAKELYIAYCRELSDKESKALKLRYVIGHMSEPEFEISSLSTILDDHTSGEMIAKATNTSLALKDKENRSVKEQERLRGDLALQKSFLASHLKHTIELLELNQKLLKDKIYSLQSINLSLLQNEMAVLEQQMKQYIESTIEAHKREKTLLEQNLNEMRIEMASLPQKWAAEQLIEQQMAINRNMIEEISKLVESKNITSNLEKIQSVPLDLPPHPVHPKSPRILLITLLGAFLGFFVAAIWSIGSSLIHGVGASLQNMKAMGKHTSGYLSLIHSSLNPARLLDTDLVTLRRLCAFMNEPHQSLNTIDRETRGNALLLVCGRGPEYAPALATLMAKSGLKVAIVDLCFDKPTATKGLLQYLEGQSKELCVVPQPEYDVVSSGGPSRYANELLASARFHEAAHQLLSNYDWVIFFTNHMIDSAEAETLLEIFPRAAMTITDETLQQMARPLTVISQRKIQATFLEPAS